MLNKQSHSLKSWIIWTPAVLFFMYQFIVRVSPGVMQDDIMRRFSISATEFGALSSIFYMTYAFTQLPVGILLDRYGPRFVASSFLSLILIGILVFIYAPNWQIAILGRALIGMGSAGGLLSTAKVTRMWFDEKMYAKVLGVSISIGVLGAICGIYPLSIMISHFGWKDTLLILVGVGIIICLALLTFVRNHDSHEHDVISSISVWQQIKSIKKHISVIKLGFCGGLIGPFLSAYADAWGVSYLTTIHELNKGQASGAISALYMGVIVGFPLTAYISDKIGSEKILTSIYGFATLMLFSVLLYIKGFSYYTLISIHFILGILCAYQVLLFALVVKQVSMQESAFVTSIVNMLNMAFGSMGIFLIGIIMDINWDGAFQDDIRIYSDNAYKLAFSILLVGLFAGSVWIGSMKVKKGG